MYEALSALLVLVVCTVCVHIKVPHCAIMPAPSTQAAARPPSKMEHHQLDRYYGTLGYTQSHTSLHLRLRRFFPFFIISNSFYSGPPDLFSYFLFCSPKIWRCWVVWSKQSCCCPGSSLSCTKPSLTPSHSSGPATAPCARQPGPIEAVKNSCWLHTSLGCVEPRRWMQVKTEKK